MIWSVAGQMHGLGGQLADTENLVVLPQMIKHAFVVCGWNGVTLAEHLLHLPDSASDTDERSHVLSAREFPLKIRRRGDMVCVSVRFEYSLDQVASLAHYIQKLVGWRD